MLGDCSIKGDSEVLLRGIAKWIPLGSYKPHQVQPLKSLEVWH